MAQAVSRHSIIVEAWAVFEVSPRNFGNEQSGTGTSFSPSTSGFHLSVRLPLYLCSIHIFMYMLLVLEGQMSKA